MMIDHLLRVCGDLGVNLDAALSGFSPAVNGTEGQSGSEIYNALFKSIAAMGDRPDLPVLIGENSASRPTHLLYVLIASSPNLARAIKRLATYCLVTEPENARIWCGDEKRDIRFELLADPPLPVVYAGIHMVRLVAVARQMTGTRIVPVSASFPNAVPQAESDAFEAFFGTKLSIGVAGLQFAERDVKQNFSYFDPVI